MLEFTGERYIPNLYLPEISYEHWHRYLWVQSIVDGKRVLDIACGEGYGSRLMADTAEYVVGVDISEESVTYAASRYIKSNLEFLLGSAVSIPVEGLHKFDIIISFETIEHLSEEDQHRFMIEVKRLLRPNGLLFISTPNKLFYSDIPNYSNEFHIREFYPPEFVAFLSRSFQFIRVVGQRVYPASYMWPFDNNSDTVDEYQLEFLGTQFQPVTGDKKEAVYLIAVCSDKSLHDLPLLENRSTLVDISDQAVGVRKKLVADQDRAIQLLHQWIDERDITIHVLTTERDALQTKYDNDFRAFNAWITERDMRLAKQESDLNGLNAWLAERNARLEKQASDIYVLNAWIAERDARLAKQDFEISILTAEAEKHAAQVVEYEAVSEQARASEQQQAKRIAELEAQLDQTVKRLTTLEVASTENVLDSGRLAITQQQLADAYTELQQIRSSFSWKIVHPIWKLRTRLLPQQSFGSKVLRAGWRAGEIVQAGGPKALIQRGAAKLAAQSKHDTNQTVRPRLDTIALQNDYDRWIEEHEPTLAELHSQIAQASEWPNAPRISILIPIYNTEPKILVAMLESVIAQTYANWELIAVNGSPENGEVTTILRSYAERDNRIQHVPLATNLGIVGNTNAGFEYVHGAYIAFVDHDDLLAPFALFEVVQAIQANPSVDMLYSDSDLIDLTGRRVQPLFKPDWSPAILYSSNYITHLCVVRGSLIQALGGLTPGSDGAQDWDMILRIGERTSAIIHIPKVLYHWRDSPSSTACDIKQKPYAMHAQVEAITRHFARQGLPAQAYFDTNGYIRATWPLSGDSKVSIIIPSRNLQLVQRCVASLFLRTEYRNFEVIIIDTTANGGISQAYAQQPRPAVRTITYTEPFNYAVVNNVAAAQCDGDILLFLNDDTEAIDAQWLSEMVRWVERDHIGVVGPKLLREDRHLQHAGVVVGLGGFAGHPFDGMGEGTHTMFGSTEWYRNYSAVTGACLAIRRTVFERIGGFDERMVLCGNDIALCLSARRYGFDVLYTPFARMMHLESATRGTAIPPQDFAISYQYYHELLEHGDPFYNPNLSTWSAVPRPRRNSEERSLHFAQRHLAQLGLPIPDEQIVSAHEIHNDE